MIICNYHIKFMRGLNNKCLSQLAVFKRLLTLECVKLALYNSCRSEFVLYFDYFEIHSCYTSTDMN